MRYIAIFIILVLLINCEGIFDNHKVCGVSNPSTQLPWLRSIIIKADSDKVSKTYKGNYIGAIYLEKFNGQDVFYSTMTMYSGGVYFHAFYCDGSLINFMNSKDALSFLNTVKKDKLIYSNGP